MMCRTTAAFSCIFLLYSISICALSFPESDRQLIDKKIDVNSSSTESISPNKTESKQSRRPDFPTKWVSQIFVEAQNQFDMHPNVSIQCRRDFELYKSHLQNQSVWAIRMLEASQWPSFGIFAGTLDHLGSYDECLMISSHGIEGQYCIAQATYEYPAEETIIDHRTYETIHNSVEEESVWRVINLYLENPVRRDRREVSWAVCIPASCRHTDLNLTLNAQITPLFNKYGLNISTNVDPIFCRQKEQPRYTIGYYIVSSLFGVLVALVIAATTHDILRKKSLKKVKNESTTMKLFRSFSAGKNWKKLMKYDPKVDIIGIHLIKVFNIIFVIYGHRYIFFIGYPIYNSESIEKVYRASSIELIHTNVVDAFFMVSGFLTFHFGVRPMMKGGIIYLLLSLVFRWIRMIPVFALLILFIINILPYMSDGPMWNYRIYNEVQKCQTTWWANLLAINNIVKTDQQCLVVSWYISADIQLAVLGSILLLIFCRYKKFGIFAVIVTFICVNCITFTVAYINQFHGLLRLYMSLLEEPRNSAEFTNFYVATYTRAGPYLVGFISALMTKLLKERNFAFSMKQKILYSILAIVIGEGSQFYGCLFYLIDRPYNRIESAVYASINRSLYTFPFAVCLCIYIISGYDAVERFLCQRFLVPLGRLTYVTFLVNTIIQLIHASTQRTLMPTSTTWNLYWWAAADILFTYIFGFILYIFAESPLINISKMLQKKIINTAVARQNSKDISKIESSATNTSSDKSATMNTKTDKLNTKSEEKSSNKNGYHNQSFVTNELVPNVSESSKF